MVLDNREEKAMAKGNDSKMTKQSEKMSLTGNAIIPNWAQWIVDGKGYPRCCYTCDHYIKGHCKKFCAPVPVEFAQNLGACDHWKFDDVPF